MTTIHWTYLPVAKPKNFTHFEVIDIISIATAQWNAAMSGLVKFEQGRGELQSRFFFGKSIDKIKHPNRIAECKDYPGPGRWDIEFDLRTTWNNGSKLARFFGWGNTLLSTTLHEIGHIMNLPHTADRSYIMHANYNESVKLYSDEIAEYRKFLINSEK